MNKGLKLIAGVFLVFFITFGFSVSSMAEGWMLICGVADYKYINDLTYTDNDARGVYNLFVNVYGKKGAKKHAKLFIDKKAKKKNIKKQFKKMARKAKPGDVFGFYFSGHGTYGPDVEPMDEADGYDEYICPYNNLLDSYKNSIRDDELEEYLSPIVAKGASVVVILDTCHSGGAIKRKVKHFGKEVEVSVKTKQGLPKVKIIDGFAKDIDKPGFFVMTACDDNETSMESPWLQHGAFTYFMLQAATGVADDSWLIGDDSGTIDSYELWNAAMTLEDMFYFDVFGTFEQTPQVHDGIGSPVHIIDLEL